MALMNDILQGVLGISGSGGGQIPGQASGVGMLMPGAQGLMGQGRGGINPAMLFGMAPRVLGNHGQQPPPTTMPKPPPGPQLPQGLMPGLELSRGMDVPPGFSGGGK
jgi:hypothetical protein